MIEKIQIFGRIQETTFIIKFKQAHFNSQYHKESRLFLELLGPLYTKVPSFK